MNELKLLFCIILNLYHNLYRGNYLRLVGKAKVDAERRVYVALQLALGRQVIRVRAQLLHVLVIQLHNLLVGADALWRDRLGQYRGSAGHFFIFY